MDNNSLPIQKSPAVEAARNYIRRGFSVIPIPFKSKSPIIPAWQTFTIAEAQISQHFNGKPQNIGVILGEKSGGLVDVDLDSSEAIKLADWFLPKTNSIFGRKSKPSSHRLYFCKDIKYRKFNNPLMVTSADERERKNTCIVEIRTSKKGKGLQTVFPPSVHESGEQIEWLSDGEPSSVSAEELNSAVRQLAAASLLLKFWRDGIRHDLAMAVAGGLLRHGFEKDEVRHFIRAICSVARDEEIVDRLQVVEDTASKQANSENTFGFPTLAELTDTKVVEALCRWLEIEKPNNENKQADSTRLESKVRTFSFTTVADLVNETPEQYSYVCEDTLVSSGISVCSAKPKVGKSTLARNLAVAVSTGASFLGRPTKKGKVIYLCLEEKRSEVAKHFQQMGASSEDILIHTGRTPEDVLKALKYALAEIEPVLVIIDPLSRVLRVLDFNDYASMARGLEPFIDLAREFNVHIMALHHDGKGGREGSDSILGSTAIFGAVDCHLQLKKRDTGRTVASTQRYGVDLPETVIELDAETGLILEKGDLQTCILQEKKDKILDSIGDNERITEAEIKERVGANSKGIISKAIRSLCEETRLFRSGEGKKNQPYLYSKNPENLEIPITDDSEDKNPENAADKNEAISENQDSGFVGFSNSENLENPEIPTIENPQSTEFYICPHCPAKIPMNEDICQSCGKRAIEF